MDKSFKQQWFVFYTKSRQEKKVRDFLNKIGFEVFLPLQKVTRQWSDRKMKVEIPLFNAYIFVLAEEHEIPQILKTPGLAWSVRINGKPAVLRQSELELIKRFMATGLVLETTALNRELFKSGDKAKIIDGPLAGIVGVISGDSDSERLNVLVESIEQVIRIQIPAVLLKKV